MNITISPSTVQMLACHAKFSTVAANRQFSGIKGRSPMLRFATGLHDVLRRCYDPEKPGTLPRQNELPLYVRAAYMAQAYRADDEREMDMTRAHRLAQHYMAQDAEAHLTTGVECHGKYPIEIGGEVAYEVSARLDRIIEMPDGMVVARDYTTGTKTLTVEQVWCNLVVLRLLRPGRADYQLQVDQLNDDNVVDRVVYPSHHLRGIVKLINAQVMAYQRAEQHLPTQGEQCLFCPLAPTCIPQPPPVSADDLDWT